MIYPFLVMGYLLYVLYAGTNFDLALYLSIILFFGIVKSLYGAILGTSENILFLSYGLVYLSVVFPAKLWALCTLKDISWGTSSRKLLQSNFSFDILCLVGWNIVLLVGLALHFTRSQSFGTADFYFLVTVLSIWVLVSVIVFLYTNTKKNKSKKNA